MDRAYRARIDSGALQGGLLGQPGQANPSSARILGSVSQEDSLGSAEVPEGQVAQEHVPRAKKKAAEEGAVVLFEDEAVFQQEGTITRTWGAIGKGVEVKSKPVRRSAKVFGAVSFSTPK